jgi:hypothetical protein
MGSIRKIEQSKYYPVSDTILESLDRYINHGIPCGSFLTACLENNLREAFGRADCNNSANLKNIVGYLYNEIPTNAWGSPEKVKEWLKQFSEGNAL